MVWPGVLESITFTDEQRSELHAVEAQIKRRVAIGAHVSERKLVDELVRCGLPESLIRRAVVCMANQVRNGSNPLTARCGFPWVMTRCAALLVSISSHDAASCLPVYLYTANLPLTDEACCITPHRMIVALMML